MSNVCRCCRCCSSCYPNVPSGLKKDSKICCLNSMIQALASSQTIIKEFDNLKKQNNQSDTFNHLIALLHGLNKKENDDNILTNTTLLESIVKDNRIDPDNWKPEKGPWDAFKYLIENTYKIFKENLKEPKESKINMPLEIKLVHRFTNSGIRYKDDVRDDGFGISVDLCGNYENPPGVKLEHILTENLSPKPIKDDESKMTQILFYKNAPDILFIHFLDCKSDEEEKKSVEIKFHIDYKIKSSFYFNLVSDLNSEIENQRVTYKIKAVINRVAGNNGGHYVTYRTWQKKWYKVDDDNVSEVKFDKSIVPYAIIYKKIKMEKLNISSK